MKICCFAGHSQLTGCGRIKSQLKKEITNLIVNDDVDTFYNGGKGYFDQLCADVVNEVKKDYPFIKSYCVLAYPRSRANEGSDILLNKFDEIFYPNLEKTPYHLAILKRNEWMVDNSDFLIVYIKYTWGGAAKTLEYAQKGKNIVIFNLADHNQLFPTKLRYIRRKNGLSQVKLAEMVNVEPSTIGMYEQGRREPDLQKLITFCNIFDVSSDYFIGC